MSDRKEENRVLLYIFNDQKRITFQELTEITATVSEIRKSFQCFYTNLQLLYVCGVLLI